MKLETAVEVWTREAIAHDYAGFVVIEQDGEIGRIFLKDYTPNYSFKSNLNIIQEVWI